MDFLEHTLIWDWCREHRVALRETRPDSPGIWLIDDPTLDQRTRVMLFANNLDPTTRSTWIATAVSSTGAQYQLPIEFATKGPGADSVTSFIVILPQDLSLHGDLNVSLTVAGLRSNTIVFGMR